MGWFIGIGIEIGIEIARIDDEVDSDSDSDSDFDALHEVAVDKLRIAAPPTAAILNLTVNGYIGRALQPKRTADCRILNRRMSKSFMIRTS